MSYGPLVELALLVFSAISLPPSATGGLYVLIILYADCRCSLLLSAVPCRSEVGCYADADRLVLFVLVFVLCYSYSMAFVLFLKHYAGRDSGRHCPPARILVENTVSVTLVQINLCTTLKILLLSILLYIGLSWVT